MTAADIARAAFDELLSLIGHRFGGKLPSELATVRQDFEQVLIALRFVGMEATCLQLDLDRIRHAREEREAYAEGRAIGGFGTDDHLDVTVIDPDDED